MGTFLRTSASLSLFALAAAAPAAGQRIDPDRVFGVTLEIDGRMMSATIREGSSLRLMRPGGEEYHFSPVLRNAAGGTVLMAVARGGAGQPQQIVERLRLSIGVPVTLRSAPTLRIVLDEIRRASPDRVSMRGDFTSANMSAGQLTQDTGCCLCCDGWCACACSVVMWCGACGGSGACQDPVKPTRNDRTTILTAPARFAALTGNTCTRGSLLDRRRASTPEQEIRTALR